MVDGNLMQAGAPSGYHLASHLADSRQAQQPYHSSIPPQIVIPRARHNQVNYAVHRGQVSRSSFMHYAIQCQIEQIANQLSQHATGVHVVNTITDNVIKLKLLSSNLDTMRFGSSKPSDRQLEWRRQNCSTCRNSCGTHQLQDSPQFGYVNRC